MITLSGRHHPGPLSWDFRPDARRNQHSSRAPPRRRRLPPVCVCVHPPPGTDRARLDRKTAGCLHRHAVRRPDPPVPGILPPTPPTRSSAWTAPPDGSFLAWWRRMLCTFQHPPGAEARGFIASRAVRLRGCQLMAGRTSPGGRPGPGHGPCLSPDLSALADLDRQDKGPSAPVLFYDFQIPVSAQLHRDRARAFTRPQSKAASCARPVRQSPLRTQGGGDARLHSASPQLVRSTCQAQDLYAPKSFARKRKHCPATFRGVLAQPTPQRGPLRQRGRRSDAVHQGQRACTASARDSG